MKSFHNIVSEIIGNFINKVPALGIEPGCTY